MHQAEKNYEFRKEMLEIHRPARRVEKSLKGSEIGIDEKWTIVIPRESDAVLYYAARDLEDYFFISMNIPIKISYEETEYCVIYKTDPSMLQNSYRFTVTENRVIFCGSDTRAAAQAGYYLEDLMNLSESPYPEKTDTVRRPLYSPRMVHSGFGLDMYPDDGISGTNTKKREEFNRMIDECMAGNIDMIITKSISRFARNTLDCLKYIRQLKEKNIPVYFEKENINTMDSKGEVLLTIMASLAQEGKF